MSNLTRSLLPCFFFFAVLIVGCHRSATVPTGNTSASPSPGTSPSKTASDSTFKRVMANVMAGETDPLPLLNDDERHDLIARTQVSTDDDGEAMLELSGCDTVYLFQDGKLIYAPCSRSESKGGNAHCLAGGTAVYNSSCANRIEQVIQTPTAEVIPRGTWITVTYLPDLQLTLTTVLKGSAEVRPVIDSEKRTLGEPTTINEGQFYMTLSEEKARENQDLAGEQKKALSMSEQPRFVTFYLRPWLDRIASHAKKDGVPFIRASFDPEQQKIAASLIDCDCRSVDFGLITGPAREDCLKAEAGLKRRFFETGKVTGTCNSVAQGPNARPKG